MAQEGTSPVPLQDHPHPSNPSPSTPSKTPRTLSFINNVQTAVAQIEDKLATSPSAYPPPPNRNEIPVTPPGPDDPVIDRVQFLESSLAISPLNRTNVSSLAESAFGGVIKPDPSLASAGVFVSTTPPTNINTTASNPSDSPNLSLSAHQASADLIDDITANVTGQAAPSIAPIVEQFETPTTPVFSKEHNSEIVGAPIAPIVEHFESPTKAKGSINQRDLVEFASGMVAPIVDQFEASTQLKTETGIPELTETNNHTRKTMDSPKLGEIEQHQVLPQETAVTVRSSSTASHNEAAQATMSGIDGSQGGSNADQNMPPRPIVAGLERADPSNDELTHKQTVKSETDPSTVPIEGGAKAALLGKGDASSDRDSIILAKAPLTESDTVLEDTDGTSEGSPSKSTAIVPNRNEADQEYEAGESMVPSENDLPSSFEASPLPSATESGISSIGSASTTAPATKVNISEVSDTPYDQATIDGGYRAKETAKGVAFEAVDSHTRSNALLDDDCKAAQTATTNLTESQVLDENDDASVDVMEEEDQGTETVGIVTADGKDETSKHEGGALGGIAEGVSVEELDSKDDNGTTFDKNATANITTKAIVTDTVDSSEYINVTSAASSNGTSADEATKASVRVSTKSNEGANISSDIENVSNETSKECATEILDSTGDISTPDRESTLVTKAPVTGALEVAAETRRASEFQTSGPTANITPPVGKAISSHRSSISPDDSRSVGRSVENRNIFGSAAPNRSTDATTLAAEAGTPDIQLDNSMNITIVVQTTSTPVSTGVTISTDDSISDKQPTPSKAPFILRDMQTTAEDYRATTLKDDDSNEENEAIIKAMHENETVVFTEKAAVSSAENGAEKAAVDYVSEKDATASYSNKRVVQTRHEETHTASEQDSLRTMTKTALLAREKSAKSDAGGVFKSHNDNSLGSGSLPHTGELTASGMLETPCDSSTIVSNQGALLEEPGMSKSSNHVEVRSPSVSSNRANMRADGQIHRQSFTRGSTTPTLGTKKRLFTARSVQKQEQKTAQSAPVSPLRPPTSSSQSFPRLPRVAGLSNARSGSTMSSRPSPTGRTTRRIPRSATFSPSIPKSNSRLSSPLLTRKSSLTSSPVTPKSTPSGKPRLPLRRTLSLTHSRTFDSSSSASSQTRLSLSQKVEEMKRASSRRASSAHLSGSGSRPPLGNRPRVTVPEPFALFGPELREIGDKKMDDARRRQAEEAARPRVFKPRPMPNFSKAATGTIVRKNGTRN